MFEALANERTGSVREKPRGRRRGAAAGNPDEVACPQLTPVLKLRSVPRSSCAYRLDLPARASMARCRIKSSRPVVTLSEPRGSVGSRSAGGAGARVALFVGDGTSCAMAEVAIVGGRSDQGRGRRRETRSLTLHRSTRTDGEIDELYSFRSSECASDASLARRTAHAGSAPILPRLDSPR